MPNKININVSEIIKKYNKGQHVDQIANDIGVSRPTIADRLKKAGINIRPSSYYRKGKKPLNYLGKVNHHGYVYVNISSNDPMVCMGRQTDRQQTLYVFEHRLVMARYIGRPLLKTEVVHHKDGDTKNNTIENLELMTASEHNRHHALERGLGGDMYKDKPTRLCSINGCGRKHRKWGFCEMHRQRKGAREAWRRTVEEK